MALTHLQQLIIERIQREGPLTFAEYMRMALYEPHYGYYMTGSTNIGLTAAGDNSINGGRSWDAAHLLLYWSKGRVEETWLEGYKAGQNKRPLIFIMRSIIAWRI